MTEHEHPQPDGLHWADFAARLPIQEHRQLVIALGAGLREARKAAQAAEENGLLQDVQESLDLAIAWLTQARKALPPPPGAQERA